MAINQKRWLKNLSIGDTVCTCKYKHLKIVDIYEERYPHRFVNWIGNKFNLPDDWRIWDWLYSIGPLWDKLLTLEDGTHCSAINCCLLADHPENIHD